MNITKIENELLNIIESLETLASQLALLDRTDIVVDLREACKNLQWAYHALTAEYASSE